LKTQNFIANHATNSLTHVKPKIGAKMANTPKIDLRNSVTECAQSIRKENFGKYRNYGIKDCIASIAATKIK
jgi:hypothetical protein